MPHPNNTGRRSSHCPPFKLARAVLAFTLALGSPLAAASGGGAAAEASDYVALDSPMVVNVFSRDTVHFVKATAQFKLKNPALAGAVKTHLPALRHTLIMLMADRPYFELTTLAGKARLRDDALEAVRQFMLENTGDPSIESVLFTSLVLQ